MDEGLSINDATELRGPYNPQESRQSDLIKPKQKEFLDWREHRVASRRHVHLQQGGLPVDRTDPSVRQCDGSQSNQLRSIWDGHGIHERPEHGTTSGRADCL